MVTHSSILAWEIPRTEEPGGLQSMGLQRVRCDLATKQQLKLSEIKDVNTFPWEFIDRLFKNRTKWARQGAQPRKSVRVF